MSYTCISTYVIHLKTQYMYYMCSTTGHVHGFKLTMTPKPTNCIVSNCSIHKFGFKWIRKCNTKIYGVAPPKYIVLQP